MAPSSNRPTPVDQNLRKYATDDQWKCYVAVCQTGSKLRAAQALGLSRSTVQQCLRILMRKAAQQGYAPPDINHEVPEGLTLAGTSIRYNGNDEIEQYWNKTKVQGRDLDEVVHLADPKKIVKLSTLFDQQGRVTQQWVAEKPEDFQREALWKIYAEELSAKIDRAKPVIRRQVTASGDLLACYPVGDHHLGMLAWGTETGGASYDLKISENLLRNASTYLMGMAPPCETALIAFLGDFLHYDSFDSVTPSSRNLLDADGRFPKMVRAGVRSMRHMITAALERHQKVHVIVEIGNHDLSSSVFLMECLHNVYENEPRVTIDTTPSHYHYFEWHKNLIGTHHGHGSKLDKLPNVMAADQAAAWGRTKHRYWWTGHIHTHSGRDFPGCSVESFRILAPGDAWSAQKGYRAIRDMKALLIHRDHGEVGRHTVNPDMFTDARAS